MSIARSAATRLAAAISWGLVLAAAAGAGETSGPFQGVKVNRGTVAHDARDGRRVLTLSEDFQKPDAPDPHWQVVDSKGRVYPLQRLDVKGDRFHRQITLPDYVPDVATVQIWCAFAETLLGEASFATPVK